MTMIANTAAAVLFTTDTPLTMGTYELSQMVGIRPTDFMRSVTRLSEAGILTAPLALSDFTTPRGRVVPEYRLNKRDSIVAIAQNSPEFTAVLVDRWEELERENKLLVEGHKAVLEATSIEEAKEISSFTLEARQFLKGSYKGFSRAVQQTFLIKRSELGQSLSQIDRVPGHFCDMNCKILEGVSLKKFKDTHGVSPRDFYTNNDDAVKLMKLMQLEAREETLSKEGHLFRDIQVRMAEEHGIHILPKVEQAKIKREAKKANTIL